MTQIRTGAWLTACLLAIAVAIAAGCRRHRGTAGPASATAERGTDAAALPAFDVTKEVEVANNGVPYERYHLELGDAPVRGPKDAAVTIIMFSDFECPYCKRGHDVLEALESRYGKRIRIAYKAFPLDFHSNAMVAAMAARTAQAEGKFWEFHDLLFSQRGLELARLEQYATNVGVNLATLRRDLDALEYGAEVRRDMREGRRLGVRSTPTFFINGRYVRGAQPIDVFRDMVDEELALAKKWRAQGVASDAIYAHAISEGYREVQYTEKRHRLDPDAIYPVPVSDSPSLGPADAMITIVMFEDFECPFCARGHDTVKKVRKRYGDKVRIVFKHNPLPFHSHAFLAARASVAAHAQGKFWKYHDALYGLKAEFDEDDLVRIAKKTGLAVKKFKRALGSAELDGAITRDQQLAMALGVTGTPAYFINGRAVEGAQPELEFRLVIQEELDRAEALLKQGVPRDELYDKLIEPQPDDDE